MLLTFLPGTIKPEHFCDLLDVVVEQSCLLTISYLPLASTKYELALQSWKAMSQRGCLVTQMPLHKPQPTLATLLFQEARSDSALSRLPT